MDRPVRVGVDLESKQIAEILLKPDEIQERRSVWKIYEEVEVTI